MKPTPRDTELLAILKGLAAYNPRGLCTVDNHMMGYSTALNRAYWLLTGEAVAKGARCPKCHRKAPNQSGCALCNPEGIPETEK